MPLLLHSLDIILVNSYVLYKETTYLHPAVDNDDIDGHKQFLIEFINSLICCAKNEDTKHSVTQQETPVGEAEPVIHLVPTQQLCFSTTQPSLETFNHFHFLPGKYKLTPHKQTKYKYCQYLVAVARVKKELLPKEGRPTQECRICRVSLCKNHKDLFHAK